jgi:hypothetical protein
MFVGVGAHFFAHCRARVSGAQIREALIITGDGGNGERPDSYGACEFLNGATVSGQTLKRSMRVYFGFQTSNVPKKTHGANLALYCKI